MRCSRRRRWRCVEHCAGDDLIGVAHQVFEQLEFPRLKRNRTIAACHLARHRVEALPMGNVGIEGMGEINPLLGLERVVELPQALRLGDRRAGKSDDRRHNKVNSHHRSLSPRSREFALTADSFDAPHSKEYCAAERFGAVSARLCLPLALEKRVHRVPRFVSSRIGVERLFC